MKADSSPRSVGEMARSGNPLLAEVLHGLAGSGKAQLEYLNYLIVQATVLFLCWPKFELRAALAGPDWIDPSLAMLVTIGLTVAYYNLRAGAEEILLPGQHALREWAIATPLALGRILSGYLTGQLLQTLQLVALSAPLLVIAIHVSGAPWTGVAWSLLAIVLQAIFFRLLAAVAYLAIGHYGATTFLLLRFALLSVYLLSALLLPAMSHVVVSSRLLAGDNSMHLIFLTAYAALSAALTVGLYLLLRRQRRDLPPKEVRSATR